MILDKRTVLEAAARGYCTPTNSHKELDAELLTAVVDEILRALAAEQPENSQQVGMSRTPETDAIDATADQNYGTDMYSDMLGHARRLERELAYWKHEFYRVEKMVLSEQDRVEELERENERLRKQAEAVAKELGLPQEALSIAGCDVLAHYVRDLRINYEGAHGKLVDLFALCKMKGMEITMFECATSPEPKP